MQGVAQTAVAWEAWPVAYPVPLAKEARQQQQQQQTGGLGLSLHACDCQPVSSVEPSQARLDKEAAALKQWRKDAASLRSMSDLHSWLHATHQCYAVSRQHDFDKPSIKDARVLASY